MLTFDEARATILGLAPALPSESTALDEAAGRVLAEDIVAPADLPGFDGSAMDGYAVRGDDFEGDGPFILDVQGENRAGATTFDALGPGTARRIFTGAPLPPGADAVIMQEDATPDGSGRVAFWVRPPPWAHVRRRGTDLRAGTVALARGARLGAGQLALAAMCERSELLVARRPVVAIVGTGDELRAPGAPGALGTIADSNGPALRAMARSAGARAEMRATVGDDRQKTERALDEALSSADVLVTIGGVSVGERDVVRPSLEAIGVTIELYKVAIKPGKPLTVGRRGSAIVIGLPGNPASAMITFGLFGMPLLRAMQGDRRPEPIPITATLAVPLAHTPGRTELLRATLAYDANGLVVTPLANQSSGAVTSMAAAHALIVVPSASAGLAAGTTVSVYLLRDLGI